MATEKVTEKGLELIKVFSTELTVACGCIPINVIIDE